MASIASDERIMNIFHNIDKGKNIYKYFLQACENGDMMTMINLFDKYPATIYNRFVDKNNFCSAIFRTCSEGHLEMTKYIYYKIMASLPNKEKKEIMFGRFNSIFKRACSSGHLEVAKWLKTISVTIPKMEIIDSFGKACQEGRLEIAEWLAGEFPDEITRKSIRKFSNNSLIYACGSGNLELVVWLTHTFSLETEDARKRGNRALLLACENGHSNIVELLVEGHFHLTPDDIINSGGNHPNLMQYPSKNGHLETVKILSKKLRKDDPGMSRYSAKDRTPPIYYVSLCKACEAGHFEIVKYLINNIFVRHGDAKELLKMSKKEGHTEVADVLIEKFELKKEKLPLTETLIEYINNENNKNIIPEKILRRSDEVKNMETCEIFHVMEDASFYDYLELMKWVINNLIKYNCIDKILDNPQITGQMLVFSCLHANCDFTRWLVDTLDFSRDEIKSIIERKRILEKAISGGNTEAIDCIIKIIDPTRDELQEILAPYLKRKYTPECKTVKSLDWLQENYNLTVTGESKDPVEELNKLIKYDISLSFARIKWLIETYNFSAEVIRDGENKLLSDSMVYTRYAKPKRPEEELSTLEETYSFIKWLTVKYDLQCEDFRQAYKMMVDGRTVSVYSPRYKVKIDQPEYPGNWFAIKLGECGLL